MISPFIPPNEDNFSQKVVSEPFRDENDDKYKESLNLVEKPKIQSLFDEYYYDFKVTIMPTKQLISSANDKIGDKN